jgi:hypothetical protein
MEGSNVELEWITKPKIATNLLDSGSLYDDDSPLHVQAKLGQGAPTIKYASKTKKIIQNEQILHFWESKFNLL